MSPYVRRTVVTSKRLNGPVDKALAAVQDPMFLIELNPLVIGATVDVADPNLYTIRDRLTILGIPTETSYTCKFTRCEDGVDTETRAGLGTKLNAQWRVRPVNDGKDEAFEVVEEVVIEALFFMIPFILSTFNKSHQALLSNMAKKIELLDETSERAVESAGISSYWSRSTLLLMVVPLVVSVYTWNITYAMLLLPCIALLKPIAQQARDPYSLFHLSLNQTSEEDTPPRTEWLNMGFWRETDRFPVACEALATKLLEASAYQAGHRVLDVGHGTGESLIFLLSNLRIPRPTSLTGITSLAVHHQRSDERVQRLQASRSEEPQPVVTLYHGDAVYNPTVADHPLDPSISTTFDTILALDCAYHFNTRRTFLTQSLRKLASGKRIALADICFSPDALSSRSRHLIKLMHFMPKENLISTVDYVRMMEEIGYLDITFEDISEDVFPSFTKFLSSRGFGWAVFARVLTLYVHLGARFVIVSGKRGD